MGEYSSKGRYLMEKKEALIVEKDSYKKKEIVNLRRRLQMFESSNQVVESNELRSRPK
jgi:hypothetical protein